MHSGESSYTLSSKQIQNLDIEGRSAVELLGLVPGAANSGNFESDTYSEGAAVLAESGGLAKIGAANHVIFSASSVFFDGSAVHLRSTAAPTQTIVAIPALNSTQQGKRDGLWTTFTVTQPQKHLILTVTSGQIAAPRSIMEMSRYVGWRKTTVPAVPPDSAFVKASTWQLQWRNPDFAGLSNVLLQLDYTGDVGRLSSATTLLDDNFFNGLPWQVGLKRFGPETAGSPLTLRLLSMPATAPIYLDPKARNLLNGASSTPKLVNAKLIPVYESILNIAP